MKVPIVKETSILGRERMINRDTKKDGQNKIEGERKKERNQK